MSPVQTSTKLPSGTPEFRQRPEVQVPGLLRLAAGLSIVSIVGVLVYAVAISLMGVGSNSAMLDPEPAIYIALLHLVLPMAAAYTIMMNYPVSRLLITIYTVVFCVATILGKGVIGELIVNDAFRTSLFFFLLAGVLYWLYGSARMRFYYAVIGHKPVPEDLQDRIEEFTTAHWIPQRLKSAIDWTADHLETVVLLGFVVVVLYAFIWLGP